MDRADAHVHLFTPGYVNLLPESCRRAAPDEVTLYEAYAERYGIRRALVVGYEGQPWAAGNNAYLARLAARHTWVRPTAFAPPAALSLAALEGWQRVGFVGVSLYLFEREGLAALAAVPGEVWVWLAERRWLVSVNARGEAWGAWAPILERHPELRVLASHLGLPPIRAAEEEPGADAALAPVLGLARFPHTYVKLSGFYALSDPGHDYPHRQAWPYVAALAGAFGPRRLLWGSDYSPSLEWVSFPQTFGLLEQIPALDAAALPLVAGLNLLELLDAIE
jgi:predicted TIM-barrel fold metal-dependent hydrolase